MNNKIIISPSLFDHTNLKQDATTQDILNLCQEAMQYKFHSVCINPCNILIAKDSIANSSIKVCSVIGFPLGANTTDVKLHEALMAVEDGADELDMVVNIGHLKEHNYKEVEKEITIIRKNIPYNNILKVIVESSQLSNIAIIEATKVVINSGADFIKTSTGFYGGATVNAVKLMHETANGNLFVKASGGIKTEKDCRNMLLAGATRLGCSQSVKILSAIE